MNQEEFDNKLGESFKNEHLPPDKRLWENISGRLDEGKKKPFSLWLLPVFVAVLAVGAWLIGSLGGKTHVATNETTQVKASYSEIKVDSEKQGNTSSSTETTEIAESTDQGGATTPVHSTNYVESNSENNSANSYNSNRNSTSSNSGNQRNNSNSGGNTSPTNIANNNNNSTISAPTIDLLNFDFNDIKTKKKQYAKPKLTLFEAPAKEEEVVSDLKLKKGKVIRSRYTKQPVDFDSKWWWSVGMGPQISGNSAVISNDSISKVHKDLWNNRNLMTHSGTGFHTQFLLGHRFGQHFSIESGLQYNIHTEDIRFNITSYSVETRDQMSNNITAYQDSLVLWIHLVGSPDSTFYYATRNFSLATKNRYHIVTVPVKFNYEQNISANTKLVAGLGIGFSGISSKTVTHLNLINDRYIQEKKSTQFTASFSAQLGLYTNINEIGQLGFYTNFQMYSKPWELANKQYAIRMNDLQFGISFRRPLNWN